MTKKIIYYLFKIIFAAIFLVGGVAHFTHTGFYLPMMPSYLPYHLELIYISGIIEFIFGVLLIIPKSSKKSALGLIFLLIAVFPANLNMYLNSEKFPDTEEMVLLIRLPIQLIFIIWAFYYTKNDGRKSILL